MSFRINWSGTRTSDGLEFDSGAAAYKEGDYDKALDAFGKALGSKDPVLRGAGGVQPRQYAGATGRAPGAEG